VADEAARVTSPADAILDAYDSRYLIPLLSDGDPSLGEAAAYAIADEVHTRRVARGETPVGRKIGFTNRTIWSEFGVWAPIWGYVYDSTIHDAEDGVAHLAISHLLQPRIEPEIQLHFARTPPVTQDEEAILDCIDWIAHGFEVVQCPFADWKFKAPDTIAACGLHGALVVGSPVAVSGIDDCVRKLRTFTITLSKNGAAQATGSGANVLDSPLLAFAHLADVLAAQSPSSPVQSGEIVTTGTLTPAFPVAAGETWSTTLVGIDLPGCSIAFE
jgi:2-oxo-3-hexenedioate decarboxylase